MDFQAYNKILSCIEDLKFKIDGTEIQRESIYFHLNEKQFHLDELKECFKEYWFVREKATIFVLRPDGILPGKHELNVYMKHRVPYTGYFGEYLVLDSERTETLIAK